MAETHLVVGPGEADNEQFGALLRTYREAAGLSRSVAAQRSELSSEYIRLIEVGKRVPAEGQMPIILNVYGIPGPEFLGYRKIGFRGYVVEFTSRIQEARVGSPVPTSRYAKRSERIGQIVTLLVAAEDETMDRVYKLLRRN